MPARNYKQGFSLILVLIVLALIILSYFKIDIREIVDNPVAKSNFEFAWDILVAIASKFSEFVQAIIPG